MMQKGILSTAVLAVCLAVTSLATAKDPAADNSYHSHDKKYARSIQLGPRPFFWSRTWMKGRLRQSCSNAWTVPSKKTDFPIGHRGAGQTGKWSGTKAYDKSSIIF